MAINLFANELNAKVALTTKTWAELGFDSTNIDIVYLLEPESDIPVTVWRPNEPFSQLTGIESSKGYLIQPKVDLDREDDFIAPIPVIPPTTTTTTTTTTSTTSTTSSSTTSTTTSGGGQTFTITGTNNILVVEGSVYGCGDTLMLQGTFQYLQFNDLFGCPEDPIRVINVPGQVVTIGNPNWNGGSNASALSFRNCKYVELQGETISSIVIEGSTQAQRTAYYDLAFSRLSENISVSNITINNGGTGIWCKTDPVSGQPETYSEINDIRPPLMNYTFHDIILSGTLDIGIYNEGMYIGHTATYWDLTTNTPFYGTIGDPSTGWNPEDHYVIPRTLGNVAIYNMYLDKIGLDGIQCSNIDGLNIYNNEVTHWGLLRDSAHNGGILVGGRSKNSVVTCNYVHHGWGELFQFYGTGEGGATHLIYNNLFTDNGIDEEGTVVNSSTGCSFRGTASPDIEFYNNTIARTGGSTTRWNGYYGMTDPITISRNVFIQPRMNGGNTGVDSAYVYIENGASIVQDTPPNDNKKYLTVGASGLDPNNFYMPLQGSPVGDAGARYNICDPNVTTTTTTSTTSTSTSSTSTTTTTTTSSTTTSTTTGSPGVPSFEPLAGYNPSSPNQYGYLYLPPDYSPSADPFPFVVFLHGQGERGSGGTGSPSPNITELLVAGPPKFLNEGDRPTGVVIFCPQLSASVSTWEPPTIESARAWVVGNYNVDPDRFYLTGLSLGGSGTSKYVYTYPDRVAAYLIATGDTQFQRGTNVSHTVNGVRQADIPGWFHGGTADGTINVNNGVTALTALNSISPRPIYPYLVDTYWGIGHSAALWDTRVYNRKNRTDEAGTAAFDYLDWFKLFKSENIEFAATSHVELAELTNDYTDYLKASVLVEDLPAGSVKTDLTNRLLAVGLSIDTNWRVIVASFGGTVAPGNINQINTASINQPTNNLIDRSGAQTSIGFTLIQSSPTPPTGSMGTGNEYFGFPTEYFGSVYRVSGSTNTWRWTGLDNSKTYKIRLFYTNLQQNNTVHWGVSTTISGNTQVLDNEVVNTTKYVEYDNLTPSGGVINMSLSPIQAGGTGNLLGFVLFESTGGVPPTTTTTTSTTSTTTTTTSSSSTTTTTTVAPSGSAQFNFNLTSQSIAGWKDVSGSPHAGVVTATDDINGTGYRISSISGKWGNFGGSANNSNGGGVANSDFPATVMQSFWYNYSNTYPANGACMVLDQLLPNTPYEVKMIGSRSSTAGGGIPAGQNRIMEFDVSQVASTGDASEQTNQSYVARDSTTTQTFTITSNGSGEIFLGVYQSRSGDASNGDRFGFINGLIVTQV